MGAAIVYQQYQNMKEKYPSVQLRCNEGGMLWVQGILHFIGDYHGQLIEDKYAIKILIPDDYPKSHPTVHETGNRIPRDFHHYVDGSLCLGARYAIRKAFQGNPTLLGFTDNCLLPYLYSFSYKSRYGNLPVGELSHGWRGTLEYYQDFFHTNDRKTLLGFLKILANGKCGGHARCPCGSKKRIRDCHGAFLGAMLRVQSASDFQSEYKQLAAGINREKRFAHLRR